MQEEFPADDVAAVQTLIDLLRAKMQRENPATMLRDAHPKQHGLVKATFTVEDDLDESLRVGLFQPGARFDAWVRFSNQNAPVQDDYVKDIRGAAIKLMNVPGEKIPLADGNTTSQDFVTISTPVFVSPNVRAFAALIKALVRGKLALLLYMLIHPRTAINLFKSNKRHYSPLEAKYFSTTPYKFGDRIVKYALLPQSEPTPLTGNPGPDFLRAHMIEQLLGKAYAFDFCVQLRTFPPKMPVEDPGKLWREQDSPFIKLATLTIHEQTFASPEQDAFGRDLSFNPWHALPAHQPLGGINQARRVIYETLSEFRHRQNHVSKFEPASFDLHQGQAT